MGYKRKKKSKRAGMPYRICPACRGQGDRWECLPEIKPRVFGLRCPVCGFKLYAKQRPDLHPDALEIYGIQLPGGEILVGESLARWNRPLEEEATRTQGNRTLDRAVADIDPEPPTP